MAVQDCDKISNIVALSIATGDDDLAQEIAQLSVIKNDALQRSRNLEKTGENVDTITGLNAHQLELRASSAEIKIRAIVQASILKGDMGDEALLELAREIRKTKGSLAGGVELLDLVQRAERTNYAEIARLWDDTMDVDAAMDDIRNGIAEFTASGYSIREYSDFYNDMVGNAKKAFKDEEIDMDEFKKQVLQEYKDITKKISKGENPSGFVKLDNEWQAIKKVYGDDPQKAGKAWTQYIMAREMLADGGLDDGIIKAFELGGENLVGDLTLEWLTKCKDLDQLMARAFTNTEQLYKDATLRELYRNKLTELASGIRLTEESAKKIKSLIKISQFAEQGATLSDVLLDNKAFQSMKSMGYKVSESQGRKIYNSLKTLAKNLGDGETVKLEIAGMEVTEKDVIQLIYDITGDDNIIKLLDGGNFSDTAILGVATQKLLGDNEKAKSALIKLFQKGKEGNKITQTRGVFLRAVTGLEVPDGAKVGFFDYRKSLGYFKDETTDAKANFMDKLAEKNKMRIDSTGVVTITDSTDVDTLADELKKEIGGGFLIVNDSGFRDNETLRKARNKLKGTENEITMLFPRGGMMANFSMDNGVVYFKTMSDTMFDNIAGTISIQSMGQAKPTREMLASAYEAQTGRNGDKLRYQASYNDGGVDNLGRQISDQQVEHLSQSEIRDENGYLLTMYHGTNSDFSVFDYDKIGKGKGLNEGPGFYFSADPYKAGGYGGRQIEVYLDIRNPFHLDGKKKSKLYIDDIRAVARDLLDSNKMTQNGYDEMMSYLDNYAQFIKKGEDGREYIDSSVTGFILEIGHRYRRNAVGVTNGLASWEGWLESFSRISGYDGFVNHSSGDRIYTAVAFSQNQIKSVDNRLPTADPNIHFQVGYHGGGTKFERFNLKYSGTGEGGAAHGYGVYIAKNKDTAGMYADEVSANRIAKWKGITEDDLANEVFEYKGDTRDIDIQEKNQASSLLNDMSYLGISFEEAYDNQLKYLEDRLERRTAMGSDEASINGVKNSIEALKKLKKEDFFVGEPTRHFYTVDFPDPKKASTPTGGNYLNEHLPLSKQEIKEFQEYFAKNGERYMDGEWDSPTYGDVPFIRGLNEYVDGRELYIALENTLGSDEAASRFLNDMGYDGIHYWGKQDGECRVIFDADKIDILDRQSYMRRLGQYTDQADITAEDAMKVQLFTKDRTWEQIANGYGFSIEYVHGTDMIQGVKAYGAYGNGVIYFTDIVKESTPPHELFHGIFNMYVKGQDPDMYERVLRESSELFGVSEYKAEEILADSFAEWFRTGEFTYGEKLKKEAEEMLAKEGKIKKKGLNKEQRSLVAQILEYFKEIARQLGILDNHRAEVKQMFEDMVNMKYLPDEGKPVNADAAMLKYNKELNDAAVRYFGEMLGFSSKNVDDEYIRSVQTTLSDMLGMDIKAFDSFQDNSQLWQRIDKELSIERITAGRFDKEVVDIKEIRDSINGLSNAELSNKIKESFGDLVRSANIETNENIDLIREGWFEYNTATTTEDLLAAKGKVVSLANGVQPQELSMEDLQTIFREKTFNDRYKEMFFPNQDVDKKDFERFVRQINSDIFDGLSIQFAENLVRAGYSLPLVNVKQVVNDYLLGKLDLNSDFAQAFFFKNNIPFTRDNLETIMSTMMPNKYSFDFESYARKLDDDSLVGNIYRVVETKNQFLPDSYSALYAIEDAGNNIILGDKDYKVLEGMLDSYKNAVLNGVKSSDFTFKDAQKLKQEFGYALDMFEQDYLIPKYGQFLTPQQRQAVQGMKYKLPIGVSGQPYSKVENMLNDVNQNIMGTYRSVLGDMVSNNDINAAIAKGYNKQLTSEEMTDMIERRREQLQNAGATIKEVNGEFIVYNSKDALWQAIQTLPNNIQGLAGLKALSRRGVDDLTNQQAYILLRYIEATKALSSMSNLPTQLMYKQNPQLAQYSFFSTYAVDTETGLPKIMNGNSLNSDTFFDNIASSSAVDKTIKEEVFAGIIKTFKKSGYITDENLSEIINEAIKRQVDDLNSLKLLPSDVETAKAKMQNIYTNMFIPYTYLRDIPDGGKTLAGTDLVDIKERVTTTMKAAYDKAIEDLKAAGATDADRIQQMITVRLDDGQIVNLEQLSRQDADSWKKSIFNDESVFVRGADDTDLSIDPTKTLNEQQKTRRQDKEYRERVQNDFLSSLQATLNQGQIITDAEREMMTSFMSNVRTDLRKYSLTSKLVDSLDALSGMNEEVARGIKNYLIGFMGTVTFGKVGSEEIIRRYRLVKETYEGYYGMSLDQLTKINANRLNEAELLALNAARYFKNMERMLGSADGATGISTNAAVNRAFYHIGEVFMGLDDKSVKGVRGIFSMLSAIEQNQVLKFFKFSKQGQPSYIKEFKQSSTKDLFWDGLGGYRDYVQDISPEMTREKFNVWFGTNFDDDVFKRVLQGLSGFSLSGGGLARVANKVLDIMNGSNIVFRFFMSYPGQLLTIPQQGVAYFLKQIGFSQKLGIEDMSKIDDIRESFGILDGAYNELNLWGKTSFNLDSKDINTYYNRYGIPDISKAYKNSTITTSDDYINMYAKLDNKYSKPSLMMRRAKWFDPYKDNANNFIDGIFARNFKNVAFVKGLRDNNFMKFTDAEAFLDFMNDATISGEIKTKLLDAVAAASGRNFRNILGLGFGGLDRAVGANGAQNIFYGVMQMFNFRGAWGQNIFKQTFSALATFMKFLGSGTPLSPVAKEEALKFIANSPEFVNFTTALFNDLEWAFKLQRYQDNGRWPDEDGDEWHYALDFLSFMRETFNMTSQWFQGLQSFGPMRPFMEMADSRLRSALDPTVYKDTWGMGAFFNAWGKNFLRQWKPVNWLAEMFGAIEAGGLPNRRAYIQNKFFNLSFGSLRYMVNEDMNAYGYTYEVTGQYGGIPGIVMGEAQLGSDKSFTYELDANETWNSMQIIADPDIPRSDKKAYWGNLWKGFWNATQFWSSVKNITKVAAGKYDKSFFTADDFAEVAQTTEAGREFYSKGYVTPRDVNESNKFFKTILNHSEFRPGSTQFSKSLMQYETSGHMDKAKGNKADAQMELWLDHVKYKTNEHGEFVLKDGERQIDEDWTSLIKNVKTYYNDEEYVRNTIYNYFKSWLDEHSSDPNYPLYLKMLGQGNAHLLIEDERDRRIAEHNVGKKGTDKRTKDNFNQAEYDDMLFEMGNSVLPGDNMTFFDKLNRLDADDATLAAMDIILNQSKGENRKILEKFYTTKTSTVDGEVVEDMELKYQYKTILEQIGRVGRAMDEGNVERVLASMSSLTNMFKNDDPTGIVTANLIDSIYNRNYQATNLSPEQKQEIMIGVFYDNKDFIQRSPTQMRELLGDTYDEYARLMNEMIYSWDGQLISNLESIITSGKSESGAASASKKASGLSKLLKNFAADLGNIGGGTTRTGYKAGQGRGQWVPVKVKGADLVKELGLKGYTPNNIKEVFQGYKPHVDLSLKKDINRKIKTSKTQEVSSKKQLSNLEEKAAKALEAES